MANGLVDDDRRSAARRALLVAVPAGHYGVRLRFERRMPGVLGEGLHLKIPFVDEIVTIPMHVVSLELACSLTSRDHQIVDLRYSAQYRPDSSLTVAKGPNRGANVFVCMAVDELPRLVGTTLCSQFGTLGGWYDSVTLLKEREALQALLNAVARQRSIPHEAHQPSSCGLVGCPYAAGTVSTHERLSFYRAHTEALRSRAAPLDEPATSPSDLERLCGIRILAVQITHMQLRGAP